MAQWDEEVDLICVGSGISGCAAAIAAAEAGLRVVLLEKSHKLGGTQRPGLWGSFGSAMGISRERAVWTIAPWRPARISNISAAAVMIRQLLKAMSIMRRKRFVSMKNSRRCPSTWSIDYRTVAIPSRRWIETIREKSSGSPLRSFLAGNSAKEFGSHPLSPWTHDL